MQEEWIDLRDKMPVNPTNLMKVQVQIICYFDCDEDGSALTAWIPEYEEGNCDAGWLYPFPIDLTNKKRKWKWKLNENDKNHWEDTYAWVTKKHGCLMALDNYHYYRKRKNEFKSFKKELPMNGSSIILQFEVDGRIDRLTNGELWLVEHGPRFMCSEMQKPIKIDLTQTNIVWKWKY